jgi:hypothetical protein
LCPSDELESIYEVFLVSCSSTRNEKLVSFQILSSKLCYFRNILPVL